MIEIAENKQLSNEDKSELIKCAQTRFTNRRRMAYWALISIIVSLGLLFAAAFIDGLRDPCTAGSTAGSIECPRILASIASSNSLFIWIEGFLTAIVAAYYGVSTWRPAS